MFGYAVGPYSWKKYVFPPATRRWSAERTGAEFSVEESDEVAPKFAFIGVRSCELHAIAIQDRVFMGSGYVDPTYARRREGIFIVAVNCAVAGARTAHLACEQAVRNYDPASPARRIF